MKTKIETKYVWYRIDIDTGVLSPALQEQHVGGTYRFLKTSRGYDYESEAISALLNYVDEDIYRFNEFTLVKTYRVIEED